MTIIATIERNPLTPRFYEVREVAYDQIRHVRRADAPARPVLPVIDQVDESMHSDMELALIQQSFEIRREEYAREIIEYVAEELREHDAAKLAAQAADHRELDALPWDRSLVWPLVEDAEAFLTGRNGWELVRLRELASERIKQIAKAEAEEAEARRSEFRYR